MPKAQTKKASDTQKTKDTASKETKETKETKKTKEAKTSKETKGNKLTKEQFFEHLDNLTVLELADYIEEFEERYGVSASAAAMPAAAAAPAAGEAAEEEEKSEFDVVLKEIGDKKINVIKTVREVTSLGLKEAKDVVDNAPKPIKEGVSKDEAEEIKKKFEEVGAVIEIK